MKVLRAPASRRSSDAARPPSLRGCCAAFALASLLACEVSRVNIKAKTHEYVDAIGEGVLIRVRFGRRIWFAATSSRLRRDATGNSE